MSRFNERSITGFFDQNTSLTKRTAAIVPAFNESQSIEEVVNQVKNKALVIVIDDGSTDETAAIALDAGAYVVRHSSNRGYDDALETGLRTSIELGCVYAVTMDADGQHDPSVLDHFVAELEAGADLVIGVRNLTQRWSEDVFSFVGNCLWGIHDPLCGMKGYRIEAIRNEINLNTYASIGTELAIRMLKDGRKFIQVPIITRPRNGTSKFGSGINANLRIVKSLLKGLLIR